MTFARTEIHHNAVVDFVGQSGGQFRHLLGQVGFSNSGFAQNDMNFSFAMALAPVERGRENRHLALAPDEFVPSRSNVPGQPVQTPDLNRFVQPLDRLDPDGVAHEQRTQRALNVM